MLFLARLFLRKSFRYGQLPFRRCSDTTSSLANTLLVHRHTSAVHHIHHTTKHSFHDLNMHIITTVVPVEVIITLLRYTDLYIYMCVLKMYVCKSNTSAYQQETYHADNDRYKKALKKRFKTSTQIEICANNNTVV